MAAFRILHVSDLHIATKPQGVGIADMRQARLLDFVHVRRASSHDADLLEAIAAYAYDHRDNLDAIVLTGDLATTGSRADLKAAHAFVHSKPTTQWRSALPNGAERPTLQAARLPVYVIPGNHDLFSGARFVPGGRNFDSTFTTDWTVGQSAQVFPPLVKGGSRLVFVGADLTLRKKKDGSQPWGYLGQGRVYQPVADTLRNLTLGTPTTDSITGIVWLVHYPPEFAGVDKRLQLFDGQLLVNTARVCGVTVTLAGHLHEQPTHYTPAGASLTSEVYVGGTAAQYVAPKGNFIQVLEVDVTASVTTKVAYTQLKWNDKSQTFQ